MAVFRVERTGDYTVMSNFHLKDKRLSLKAKGLLSQMLSLPDDWDYTLSGLSYINRESKDAIRSAVNELETAGYIRRRQTTDASGKFAANEYTIFERPIEGEPMLDKPLSENPITVNPSAVNPLPENPTQLNTKKSNTQKQNTHGSNTDSIPFRETAAVIPPERKGRDAMSVTEIVENPKPHGKSYNKWLGDQAKPSHRELLRVAIDNALSQSPANFEELLKLLQESGCEVSKRGKSYRLKLPGWEKAARMDSLGEGYGLDDLQAVLSGKKTHTPRKKIVTQAETQKVNLLVDIQAKLQAGKGAGYARWAKVFNLKQMAQTMNYLSEHNLLEYAVLEEKAAAATAHHNELSAQIKEAEKRMAEIAVLRTHIVNYAKTREVYVDYRKAGYSKKFREEHEEEILLHQAAKNAFDEMGVKKLPKVKELQTEYAKLLEEKKKTYAEYRRSREEMRELLTAKANVDRVLKMEVEQDVEKEKDHGQR